jgi:hypothetical protein
MCARQRRLGHCATLLRGAFVLFVAVASKNPEMPEPDQLAAVPSAKQYWWSEAWAGSRLRFIATSSEIIGNVGLLLGLGIIYLVLRLLIVAGLPSEDIQFLERADLWAVKSVFLTFSFTFVIHSVIGSYASVAASIASIKEKS